MLSGEQRGGFLDYKGIAYLREKMGQKRLRVLLRYEYYDMKNSVKDFRITMPDRFANIAETLGWCGKSVDAIADRLCFRGFRNDSFDMGEVFALNNADILPDSATLSALISSCCFIYISTDGDGYPRMQVIDGGNATGELDSITNMLTEGYAVLERDKRGSPIVEAYFLPHKTQYIDSRKRKAWTVYNDSPYPLLVPIIHRPDASRPFGRSRVTRECMNLQQSALRAMRRMEVSSEFYSWPQRYILGLADDAEFDGRKASLSDFLAFGKDEDGDKPQIGQFPQQSMAPFVEQIRSYACLFAGATGLTPDDLGFVSDNPSSQEAIKASHENLRMAAKKAQKTIGTGLLNAGYLAVCVRDKFPYKRQEIYQTKPLWEPIFEPDAATLSSIGDGAIKINQAVPGFFGKQTLRDLTGIDFEG